MSTVIASFIKTSILVGFLVLSYPSTRCEAVDDADTVLDSSMDYDDMVW